MLSVICVLLIVVAILGAIIYLSLIHIQNCEILKNKKSKKKNNLEKLFGGNNVKQVKAIYKDERTVSYTHLQLPMYRKRRKMKDVLTKEELSTFFNACENYMRCV